MNDFEELNNVLDCNTFLDNNNEIVNNCSEDRQTSDVKGKLTEINNLKIERDLKSLLFLNFSFSQDKYDIRKVHMEPQRIYLTSKLLVSLRAYRTFAIKEYDIKNLVMFLLEARILK